MKKAVIILAVLLIGSNVWWFYQLLDQGITMSYRDQQLYELEETRKQLMKMMPALSASLSKEQVIDIASQSTDQDLFEKDGCTWVGWAGLKFSESGSLEHVSPAWSYGSGDPCFPDTF